MQRLAQQSKQADNAWRVLFLLFLANVFNYFDRVVPSIVMEPIRLEWDLMIFKLACWVQCLPLFTPLWYTFGTLG